jgi:hypothetical protein
LPAERIAVPAETDGRSVATRRTKADPSEVAQALQRAAPALSNRQEKMSVLFAEALRHGEDAGIVGRRAAGGQALVAEICDFATDRPAAPDISDEMIDEIRADARDAAALLWKRMAEL